MSQPKDYTDQTDPNYRPQYRGYHGGYARADVGSGDKTSMKWLFGILASVVGGIIIIQLQFFGSAVIEQGKVVARLDERLAAVSDAVKLQGEKYDRDRDNLAARISSLEQRGAGSRSERIR